MKIVENGPRCKFGEITFHKAKFEISRAVCPCQQLYQWIVNGQCWHITLTNTDICVVQRGTAVYIVTITTLVTWPSYCIISTIHTYSVSECVVIYTGVSMFIALTLWKWVNRLVEIKIHLHWQPLHKGHTKLLTDCSKNTCTNNLERFWVLT